MRTTALFALAILGSGAVACADRSDPTIADVDAGTVAELAAAPPTTLYDVTYLDSDAHAGGRGAVITNRGDVIGFADLPGGERRATLWRDGEARDLGTLGGAHSSVVWHGRNDRGMIAGIAETDEVDELGQQWSCREGFFFPDDGSLRTCAAFVWDGGTMRELPTLGGQNSFATGMNNRGEIVGWTETDVADPTCVGDQVRQFRAVVWDGADGVRELPPLPGDSTSAATAVNERGQVVGISGDCGTAVGGVSARRAVLWERGEVTELDDLGGLNWHTPMDINRRGEVVGFSNADDDGVTLRAFLWTAGEGVVDLKTLEGDAFSQAHAIDQRGRIVGISHGGEEGPRAVLWEDRTPTDLNARVVDAEDPRVLLDARHINDRGQITGQARDPDTGKTFPFVATPVRGGSPAGAIDR